MSDTQAAGIHTLFVILGNATGQDTVLWLEPWAYEFPFPHGSSIQVVAQGPDGDGLDILLTDERVTVWGWTGSTVALYRDGRRLSLPVTETLPVPVMPGLSPTVGLEPPPFSDAEMPDQT
jgi:hypothetical protein